MRILRIILFIIIIALILSIIMAIYIVAENYTVTTVNYDIYSEKNKSSFNNYKIAVIADFHNSGNYEKIIKLIQKEKPDITVIVGDTINMFDETYENAQHLIKGIKLVAPTYIISGNHEVASNKTEEFFKFAWLNNVKVIDNKVEKVYYKNNYFNLIGYGDIVYDDPNMRLNILEQELKDLYEKIEDKEVFNVLLFHRGNFAQTVAKFPFDLIISGHTHGGQINLPYINEYILKSRFNNTEFSKGLYRIGNSQIVISGGLERNLQKPRIFNPPEVVFIILKDLK